MATFLPAPSFKITSPAFRSTQRLSSISIREFTAAIPMEASRRLSDLAYWASSSALHSSRWPARGTRGTGPAHWGSSGRSVEASPQRPSSSTTAVQKPQTRTSRRGASPLREAIRSSMMRTLTLQHVLVVSGEEAVQHSVRLPQVGHPLGQVLVALGGQLINPPRRA